MFDQIFPWTWIQTTDEEWIARFDTVQHLYTVSIKHVVNAKDGVDFWDGSYGIGANCNQTGITNEYKAMKIVSTVIDIFDVFLATVKPCKFVFIAPTNKRLDRFEVYEKAAQLRVPDDYTYSVADIGDMKRIILHLQNQ